METIASSAGGTAEVAIVAQPSTGFLNGSFYPDGSPTEDTEDCLGRITVGLTRSKSLTLLASPLDMMGLMGMAQVIAAIAYGIQGLRRGETTWDWPTFHADPEQENREQMRRWSLNEAPSWSVPPMATSCGSCMEPHGPLIQSAHEAAKFHTQRSKGTAADTAHYRPQASELPVISSELTSELLHCLSTLPDPWPLAKVTIDMEKPCQWVSKMCRLFFADDYARRTVGVPTAAHGPEVESALKAVHGILPKLEARIIEFLLEWLVTFPMPAMY